MEQVRTILVKDKTNTLQNFTVRFFSSGLRIGSGTLPLGQLTTDLLNYPDEVLRELRIHGLEFTRDINAFQADPAAHPMAEFVHTLQKGFNVLCDLLVKLPGYRDMDLDLTGRRDFFLREHRADPGSFTKNYAPGGEKWGGFVYTMQKLLFIANELISFRSYVAVMLDFFFERCKKRRAEAYAIAAYDFFTNKTVQSEVAASFPPGQAFEFTQRRPAQIEYTTMQNPENPKQYMVAERLEFDSLVALLHVDFFRGLMAGNAPRRCHNCGTFFLLTSGYNTCYCNNVAPGEIERTCRKVGAHRKEASREGKSPIRVQYDRVYSRLAARKSRGTISVEEWNRTVAKAQEYKARAVFGKIEMQRMALKSAAPCRLAD